MFSDITIHTQEVFSWLKYVAGGGVLAWVASLVHYKSRDLSAKLGNLLYRYTIGFFVSFARGAVAVDRIVVPQLDIIRESISLQEGIIKSEFQHSNLVGFWCDAETLQNMVVTELYRDVVGARGTHVINGSAWRLIIGDDQKRHYEESILAQRGDIKDLKEGEDLPVVRYEGLILKTLDGDYAGKFNVVMSPVPYKNGRQRYMYIGELRAADMETVERLNGICARTNIPRVSLPPELVKYADSSCSPINCPLNSNQ